MRKHGFRVGTYLVWLVVAVSVPLLLFTADTIWRVQIAQREQRNAALVNLARDATAPADRTLERMRNGLLALSEAGSLANGNLPSFAKRMALTAVRLGVSISLASADGEVLLTTADRQAGESGLIELEAKTARGLEKPAMSNLLSAGQPPRYGVAVAVPAVRLDNKAAVYTLIAIIDADRLLQRTDLPPDLPEDLAITFYDRDGATIARYPPDVAQIGKPAPAALRGAVGQQPAGLMPGRGSLGGTPSIRAYGIINSNGYVVTAAVPEDVFEAPYRRDFLKILLIGGVFLVAGLLAATAISRRLVTSLNVVDQGDPAQSRSGLREVDELATRLQTVSAQRDVADATLRASEERLRDLIGTLDLAAVMVRELGGTIRFWSHGCQAIYGWTREEAIGKSSHELLRTQFPIPLTRIEHALLTRGEWKGDLVHRRRDGTLIIAAAYKALRRDAAGQPHMVMESLVDVTALREAQDALCALNQNLEQRVRDAIAARETAQQRMAHTDRVQALGQLAGGIAHDFNNVLQAVAGGAALIARRPEDLEAVSRLIQVVGDAAARGASITRRMLLLTRRADLKAEAVDVVPLLMSMRSVFIHTLGAAIEIQVDAPPDLPRLKADKGQLETALVNLATNARDAMPDGGTIRLEAEAALIQQLPSTHFTGLPPGCYVRLSVADGGTGMTRATLARAGEPFYTTKDVGKGTGLGLSMVKGFAEQSGGGFALESAVGAGTVATLWLPAMPNAVSVTPAAPRTDEKSARTGQILLVDDDPMVRDTLMEQLQELGHKVLTASGGLDALAILRARQAVDLMITDLSMPGMNGLALIKEAHDLRPGMPAILLTGFAGDLASLESNGVPKESYTLIGKPTTSEALGARVATFLERTM